MWKVGQLRKWCVLGKKVKYCTILILQYQIFMTKSFVCTAWLAANAETNEHNQANGVASSSSGDQTATISTDVATPLLSPPNSEMLEVIVQSPPAISTDEIATNSTSSSSLAPTNAVAFEVAPSEFASTGSGHQPATHFTMADVFVATYSMVADLISFAYSF
jgi:hypothetical protein